MIHVTSEFTKFAISARSSCAELNSMTRARSGRVKQAESHEKTRSWEIKICVNAEVSHAWYMYVVRTLCRLYRVDWDHYMQYGCQTTNFLHFAMLYSARISFSHSHNTRIFIILISTEHVRAMLYMYSAVLLHVHTCTCTCTVDQHVDQHVHVHLHVHLHVHVSLPVSKWRSKIQWVHVFG